MTLRVLNLDASISLNAQAIASLGVTAGVKVTSSMNLPNVWLVFPPSEHHGQSYAEAVPMPASASHANGDAQSDALYRCECYCRQITDN